MNKIEQLHSDAIKQSIQWVDWNLADRQINETASKSADITQQIAIEFVEWIEGNYFFGNIAGKWLHMTIKKEYSSKELFQEFLKIKQLI